MNNLALLFLIISIIGLSLFHICDFDIWHHLSIGKYIWENKKIPDNEFLVYPLAGKEIVHSEWFFQVLVYLAYLIGSYKALPVFKTIIIFFAFIFLYKIAISNKLSEFIWFPIIFFSLLFSRYRFYERPEIFGYLFISAIFYLIELYERKKDYTYFIISIGIILIWVNTHLSFIFYFIILGSYLIDNLINVFFKKSNNKFNDILFLLIIILIAYLASLYNPYGLSIWNFIFKLRSTPYLESGITEMLPVLKTSFFNFYLIIAIISLMSIIAAIIKKYFRSFYLFLYLFSILLPLKGVRFTTFFVLICTYISIKNFSLIFNKERMEKFLCFSKISKMLLFIIIVGILLSLGWLIGYGEGGPKFGLGIMNDYFPNQAADFLLENKIPGPMFNTFDWGHYLAWKLYPLYQVFIDGRVISALLFYEHDYVMNAKNNWEKILDKYKINFIITNSMYFDSGDLFPLIAALINSNNWILIYKDEKSLIFIKNNEKNKFYIEHFKLSKDKIYDEIISEAHNLLKLNPSIKGVYASLRFAYMHKK